MQENCESDDQFFIEKRQYPIRRWVVFWGVQILFFAGFLDSAKFVNFWSWWLVGLGAFACLMMDIARANRNEEVVSMMVFLGKMLLWSLLASFIWFGIFFVTAIADDNYTWGYAGLLLSIPLGAASAGLYGALGLFAWTADKR